MKMMRTASFLYVLYHCIAGIVNSFCTWQTLCNTTGQFRRIYQCFYYEGDSFMPKKRPNASETEKQPFPVRLRAAMSIKRETQVSLSKKVTMKRQTIGYYMNGQSQPNVDGLSELCKALQVSADYLIGISQKISVPSENQNIFGYFGDNAVSLVVEKAWGGTERADFISSLLSDPEDLDRLIAAIKARQKEKRENNIILDLDFVTSADEEKQIIDTATRALVERYFWKIIDKTAPGADTPGAGTGQKAVGPLPSQDNTDREV